MRRILRTLLLGLLGSAPSLALADLLDQVEFHSVASDDQVSFEYISALAQDHAGFIWVGTPSGLVRYDGYRFRPYLHRPGDANSLAGEFVRCLIVSRDRKLWVGTEGGLSRFDPDSERFQNWTHSSGERPGLSNPSVRALAEEADGSLWIGTLGGLDRLHPDGHIEHFRHREGDPDSLLQNRALALLIDRAQRLWVGTDGGIAWRPAGATAFVTLPPMEGADGRLAQVGVRALFEASDGRIWVGTAAGTVLRIDATDPAGGLRVQALDDAGNTASVRAIAQPLPDEIWLGRADGSIDVFALDGDRPRRQLIPAGADFARVIITSLLHDRAGQVWIGGYGGGLQWHDPSPPAMRTLRHNPQRTDGLSFPAVHSVLVRSDGRLWLGTGGNGIDLIDRERGLIGGIREFHEGGQRSRIDVVTALHEAANGDVWIGLPDGQLLLAAAGDPAALRRVVGAGVLGEIRVLAAAAADAVWVGSAFGVWRVARDGQLTAIAASAGSSGDTVNALIDVGERLWVGSNTGLAVVAAGTTQQQRVNAANPGVDDLPAASVVGMLFDRQRRLWIDTPQGLARLLEWNGQVARFERVSEQLGLAGRAFGGNLFLDAEGRLWSQWHVYDPARKQAFALTRADGVDPGHARFRSAAQTADGLLLFGGSRGLTIIEPARFRQWEYAPPVVVSELRVDGQPRPPPATLVIAPGQRSFSVEVAALDYTLPSGLRYRYRLDGYEDGWIDTDASRRLIGYSNLWPGDYTLRVLGSNRRGVFGPQEWQLPVRVQPAFWQTLWFAALLLLALSALAYAGYRWRTARIRLQARELQGLVDARTHELRLAKERAELALLELKGTQRQLVSAERMAALGGLVAGVAHEINTPVGVAITAASHLQDAGRQLQHSVASGRLSRSALGDYLASQQEGLELVLGSLERTSQLVASFKQIAVEPSQEQRRCFDLLDFLNEISLLLAAGYRNAGHRLEIDCPAGIELESYPGALLQIFNHLIANAVVHGFRPGQQGGMRLQARRQDAWLELSFSDDGVGIEVDAAAKVFEPFYTTRRGSGHAGLGLHLVYNLATQLLGGSVTLRTAPGQGCTVLLRIPVVAGVPALADDDGYY